MDSSLKYNKNAENVLKHTHFHVMKRLPQQAVELNRYLYLCIIPSSSSIIVAQFALSFTYNPLNTRMKGVKSIWKIGCFNDLKNWLFS
jgi:hypothetical protein